MRARVARALMCQCECLHLMKTRRSEAIEIEALMQQLPMVQVESGAGAAVGCAAAAQRGSSSKAQSESSSKALCCCSKAAARQAIGCISGEGGGPNVRLVIMMTDEEEVTVVSGEARGDHLWHVCDGCYARAGV